ncbi:MAG: tRNA (adenosine(37)-N6)-threonylcarbamoyltransferase complex ATPase subunit type 1 TsaE [Actinomycetota bacterium]|jgi:tRNA threonylcarbamoyladenosine biosynthesis protein TsaE|nr:tRNA (adenosine(37)-N6)-threonylcarbamoyltransferase complex ATPase subunit type 1 TsaE [Actinomycetota bacterium]MDQ3899403.1 tRNA (adenosine(37)-N6)-threonylcarbamoyltransferase complex ATPase subunit type 1 TsaE [Actinomycetota bacterium]
MSPVLELATAADTERLGRAVGARLRAGDVVVLSGPLGAGKTVLARGIGAGLGVRGPITSPTFVIAREHPALPGGRGIPLVHVDAYRLGGIAELDDLDLDTDLLAAAVVVEWGEGMAERLADEHLLIRLQRRPDDDNRDDRRVAQLCGPARLIPEPACLAVAREPEMCNP